MTRFSLVLIVTACVGMFAGIVFAQDEAANGGTLRGTIVDTTEAQNPIEGVDVKIIDPKGTEYNTKTDANGEYKRNLPAGRYLISTFKRGYMDRLGKPVTVVNGGGHVVPLRMGKKGNDANRWTEGLLRHVTESMGKRYNLGKLVVEALRQSILEALNTVLEQMNRDVSEFATTGKEGSIGLLDGLFAHPDCRAAFTKYLTEAQLQDYIDFIKTLQQRDQQAVARHITAWLNQELSLTAEQRKSVEQLILDTTENESFPIAISILEIDSLDTINLVHRKLKIPLDRTLSQTQSKIWKKLRMPGMGALVKAETEFQKQVDVRRLTEREAKAGFDGLKNQLWGEEMKSQERTKQLIETKLTAHTELLGTLDENASRRLTIAINGVVQQFLDAPYETNDIINHPLYQQAIKDVLSEEAFMQYKETQAETEAFHQQTLRDLVVASLGTLVILDDAQWKYLETTVANLDVDLSNTDALLSMFYQLFQRIDDQQFGSWQQEMVTLLRTAVASELHERMEKE